jgi:hypothetical protein
MSSYSRFLTMPARVPAAGLVAMLMSLFIAPVASAAGTLDQSQTAINGAWVGVCQTQWVAQTFTAGLTGLLDQVDVHIKVAVGNPGPLTVEIRTVLPGGAPSGVVLTSASVPEASVPTPSQLPAFVPVPLSPPAPSVSGTQYAIVLRAAGADCHAALYYWSKVGTPYPGGTSVVSIDSGSTWGLQSDSTAFRTYVSANAAVVPEAPLALLLPIAGLVVLGLGVLLTRKRRRRSALG